MSLSRIFSSIELENIKKESLDIDITTITKQEIQERGLIIFGAGKAGRLALTNLLSNGITPLCFIDNDEKIDNTFIEGIPIHHFSWLREREREREIILLANSYAPEILKQCRANNINNCIMPAALSSFLYIPGELGTTFEELDKIAEIETCFSLLADEESKHIYKNFIKFICSYDKELFKFYNKNIYFADEIKNIINYSSFLDVGANKGDTLQDWLSFIGDNRNFNYEAFEPNPNEFRKLEHYVESLPSNIKQGIYLHNCALGEKNTSLYISDDGVGSTLSETGEGNCIATTVKRLDDITLHRPPKTIKVDVEGYENKFLDGASQVIKEYQPSILMCIYHKKYDFFQLPLRLHQLCPNHKIYMRQHMPIYGDTVCYAISQ